MAAETSLTSFKIKYSGEALQKGEMNARQLSLAILALDELISESHKQLNPSLPALSLNFQATEKGSFVVELGLAYQGFVETFSSRDVSAILNLLNFLGLSGGIGGLWHFFKIRKGRKGENITPVSEGMARVYFGDEDVIEVPKEVLQLFLNPSVRKFLYGVFRPLENSGIDSFKAICDDKETFSVNKDELKYFDLPKIENEEISEYTKGAYFEGNERDYIPDLMVKVPASRFLYGDGKKEKVIDYDYKIDVYPVTNERYSRFVNAGGYEEKNKEYWSPKGWDWRESGEITQPGNWDDPEWNQPDHPVVGVSWYEAEAFAKWEGKRLPTEREWEKAARGTEGRKYPWGDEFDKEKCNSNKSGIGTTTPVTRYVNGLNPYRCYDMAGNVWEWQSDWYDDKEDRKVLRGGSWYNGPDYVRSADRLYSHPSYRSEGIGFRFAQ